MKINRVIVLCLSSLCFMQNCLISDWIPTGPTVDGIRAGASPEEKVNNGCASIRDKMHVAINKGDCKEVERLINNDDADPNGQTPFGATFLNWAVLANNLEVTELLLAKGANPNLGDKSTAELPLHGAIVKRNIEMVKLLLKYKADPKCKLKEYEKSPAEFAGMILGYPSRNGNCHPIYALLNNDENN